MSGIQGLILLAIVALLAIDTWYRCRHLLRDYLNPKPKLCPKCGGALDVDPYRYKHTLLWTCRECNHTYETLRR